MKLEVSRSFSRKKQIAPYEPIELFCAAKIEMETNTEDWEATARILSQKLDAFVQSEVEGSIARFKKPDTVKSIDVAKDSAERDTEQEINDDPEIVKEIT